MKKILITRARAQAAELADKLSTAGFEPIYFPVIEIKPVEDNIALERALSKLSCYEWVVFTSTNAVEAVFDQFPSVSLMGAKTAAVGPKTAEALKSRGVQVDFVPQAHVAEAILPGLGDVVGKWILLPRAELARKDLPEAIAQAGGVPHEIVVYQTILATPSPESLASLRSGVDVITFTSESTVQNFLATVEHSGLDPFDLPNNPVFACIGPITEQAAKVAGFSNVIVAKEYTSDGLISALKNLEHS